MRLPRLLNDVVVRCGKMPIDAAVAVRAHSQYARIIALRCDVDRIARRRTVERAVGDVVLFRRIGCRIVDQQAGAAAVEPRTDECSHAGAGH